LVVKVALMVRSDTETHADAMGRALDTVSAREARGFFDHCGYREIVQLL
jgi:hypothetical protein